MAVKEKHLTPATVVVELDKYIIGQERAKRAVAIALRNRWRRQQLSSRMREEVAPKNIIMIGSTGIGKTEIARRLAQLAEAPLIKVEASKYTEVGYVGRDVESIIRDLLNISLHMVRMEMMAQVESRAKKHVEQRILDVLLPLSERRSGAGEDAQQRAEQVRSTREMLRGKLVAGDFEDRSIEIKAQERTKPVVELFGPMGTEQMGMNFQDLLSEMIPTRTRERRVSVKEARKILLEEESQKLIDKEKMVEEAIWRVENSGIVFIDEIDKVAGESADRGEVSREGVQRDLLPIVEGTTVNTRHGPVKTDHILFIAAGAFHGSSPSDLIPELQGRFPIRVELDSLDERDFARILSEPENALVKQYQALLATEDIILDFEEEAIAEIAHLAHLVNERTEDIGARRLHTVMERLLEQLSFEASSLPEQTIEITRAYVRERLADIVEQEDLSRYIL